ncbi:MAG TPA: helicase-related protein, partial [Gemmata sp.]|nr:helicase-related protein [Gemmata sp.]
TRRLYIDLTPEEEETYRNCREEYRRFVAERNISMSGPDGFKRFLFEASKTAEGMKALRAYREQKRVVQAASGKFTLLEDLLKRHATDRTLIFTADNATVYHIARRFLIPAMTNQTRPKERKAILDKFNKGEYTAVVTCQVLNEGVDVPAAGVGIVLGGTGSATENVQRLGRILRKHGDKQAVLYEVIARNTTEEFVSDRRRQHRAFQ